MGLIRARLAMPTVRRAAGLYEGSHTSILTGKGTDFEDLTEYRPGDDVRDIDWKVSARAGSPVIKRYQRETDVFTQLVVDTSREMLAVTPSGDTKAEVALLAGETLAFLSLQRGDRLGMVMGDSQGIEHFPGRHGQAHLEYLMSHAEGRLAAGRGSARVSDLLDYVLRTTRERSLVVLVTDQYWPRAGDEMALRRVRTRHELLVVRVADMPLTQENIEQMSEIDGDIPLPEYVRDDPQFRAELMANRRAWEARSAALLVAHGVLHAPMASTDDVLPVLLDLLRRQHRAF
ncbi:MAG: DUF58 domain-containing protein [Ancrocorticia sp.]